MTTFSICLAGVPVRVSCQFEETRDFCRGYLTQEAPALEITVDEAALRKERQRAGTARAGDPYLETLALYRALAEQLTDRDVLLFHGSAVAVDGGAYLFTAKSGTGKSTHTRLWRQTLPALGHRVQMVNDDKPLLRFAEDGIFVCGTPWAGKHRLSSNVTVPLRGLCVLRRGEENHIEPLSARDGLPLLMAACFRPEETPHLLRSLTLLDRLSREVPLYTLHCNREKEAALTAYEGMHRT